MIGTCQHISTESLNSSVLVPVDDRGRNRQTANADSVTRGMTVAAGPVVANITMWRRGDIRCVLVVEGKQWELQLFDGAGILNRQQSSTADDAVTLASVWQEMPPGLGSSAGAAH
jgi:hypothetical protein